MTTVKRGWLMCAASAVLFGATTPISKVLLDSIPPITLAGLLYLGAAVAAAPFAARQRTTPPGTADRARLAGAVIVGGAIAPVLLLVGLDRTPAPTASLLLNLELVATAVLATLIFGEHIGRRAGLGLGLLTTAGLVLAGTGGSVTWGAALIISACLCWGLDNNLTATATGITPAQITLAKGVVAGSVNLVLGLLTEHSDLAASAIAWSLVVGAAGYGASIILWIAGARLVGAARSQGVFATAPFIGVVLGWVIASGGILVSQVIALAVMALGIWIVIGSDHSHEHRHDPTLHTHAHRHDDDHHDHTHDQPVTGAHLHEHEHDLLVHTHDHLPDETHRHDHQ